MNKEFDEDNSEQRMEQLLSHLIALKWPCPLCRGSGKTTRFQGDTRIRIDCERCDGDKFETPHVNDYLDTRTMIELVGSAKLDVASKKDVHFLQDVMEVLQIGSRYKRVTQDDVRVAVRRVGIRNLEKALGSSCSGSSSGISSTSTTTTSSTAPSHSLASSTSSSTSTPTPTSFRPNPCGEMKLEVSSMASDLEVTDFVAVSPKKPSKINKGKKPVGLMKPGCFGEFEGTKTCMGCDWRVKCLEVGDVDD